MNYYNSDHLVPLPYATQMNYLAAENSRLTEQLKQKDLQERANLELWEGPDGCTYTLSKSMRWRLLATCQVERAFHCIPSVLCCQKPFYLLYLKGHKQGFFVEDAVFHKSSALLATMQAQPGVIIHLVCSEHHTASLIRLAISVHSQTRYVDFYAGWHLKDQNTAIYSTFSGNKTHLSRTSFELVQHEAKRFASAERAMAVERYAPVFSLISDPMVRAFSVLWFHCCQLSSLLRDLGHPLPLGLYLFSPSFAVNHFFTQLFRWNDDALLSPAVTPSVFAEDLLMRKDQPLLIEDAGMCSKANIDLLTSVLSGGQVPWKNGSQCHHLPVQALPTVLSSRYTSLSCVPSLLTLDLDDDLLDVSLYSKLPVAVSEYEDYRAAFVSFVMDFLPLLRAYLAKRKKMVLQHHSAILDRNSADMFAVLMGIADLLRDYFAACAPAVVPVSFDDSFEDWLLKQLQYHSEATASYGGLADQFIQVTRAQIQNGTLRISSTRESYRSDDGLFVYADANTLCFPSASFRAICSYLCESRPVVLRELRQAGMIAGGTANATTSTTKINLTDENGVKRAVPVYRLHRSFFEQLGDPLI